MATSNKINIKRDYALLNTTSSIVCVSGGSPTTQVWNTALQQYEPNRKNTPCVLHPDITAYATDNTWKQIQVNSLLANMVWLVNGQDISKVWQQGTDYTINLDGATRGDLTIMRNVAVSELFSLQFQAEIPDHRIKANIPVITDTVTLNTVAKSDDAYSMALEDDENITYNQVTDRLLIYDYKVAHGLIAESNAVRNSCIDEKAYLRKIPFHVYKGGNSVSTGFTVKLFRMSGLTPVEIGVDMNEVEAITTSYITLDLRLIESASYIIKAYVGSNEVCSKQFSVSRVYPKFTISAGQNTDIAPNQDTRQQVAMVSSEGKIVEYPANVFNLHWSTKATNNGATTTKQWQDGDTAIFNISDTGLGESADEDLEIAVDASYKEPYAFLVDENNVPLVDERGRYLISN